jgi:hypothetical protein
MPDQEWFDVITRIRAGEPKNGYETMLLREFDEIRALLRLVDFSNETHRKAPEHRVDLVTVVAPGVH